MMGKNKSSLLDDVLAGMIKAGEKIKKNVKDGQKNLRGKNGNYYGSINPFKGIFDKD